MVCRVCAVPDGCHLQASSADALGAGVFSFQGIPGRLLGHALPALASCKALHTWCLFMGGYMADYMADYMGDHMVPFRVHL